MDQEGQWALEEEWWYPFLGIRFQEQKQLFRPCLGVLTRTCYCLNLSCDCLVRQYYSCKTIALLYHLIYIIVKYFFYILNHMFIQIFRWPYTLFSLLGLLRFCACSPSPVSFGDLFLIGGVEGQSQPLGERDQSLRTNTPILMFLAILGNGEKEHLLNFLKRLQPI